MIRIPNQRVLPSALVGIDIDDRIVVYDDFLEMGDHRELLAFLKSPGWAFGAFSEAGSNPSRYWYKHFAGVVRDGGEALDHATFERQLESSAPLVAKMWLRLKLGVMTSHALTRCYANGYPVGAEGGVHVDSKTESHFTAIYYPHLKWALDYGGETVFFKLDGSDIIRAVYPRPNRLVLFPGTIPHVARGITRTCPDLRITLMFKTVAPTVL